MGRAMASRAADVRQANGGDRLFARIGAFLAAHRLSPEPAHYAFAYEVIANTDGLVARRVAAIGQDDDRARAAGEVVAIAIEPGAHSSAACSSARLSGEVGWMVDTACL